MPDKAWNYFDELRKYADTSSEGMGIPDLGQINVTYPYQHI